MWFGSSSQTRWRKGIGKNEQLNPSETGRLFALRTLRRVRRGFWVVDVCYCCRKLRDDGKRFVVRADARLSAFVELKAATRSASRRLATSEQLMNQNFLALAQKPAQHGPGMKTPSPNMTPFAPFHGLPPLHKVDQTMMRGLRALADRRGRSVEDLIREALKQWVVQCEAEGELERRLSDFRHAKTPEHLGGVFFLDAIVRGVYVHSNMTTWILRLWARISHKFSGKPQQLELNLWSRRSRR
jgi:Ribbon-helix-helix protein, copG family